MAASPLIRQTLPLIAALALVSAIPFAHAAPNEASVRYTNDGVLLLQKGNLKAAEIQLKNALREDSDNAEARFNLGIVYLREGVPAAAEATFNTLRLRGEKLDETLPLLGEAYLQQNKTQQLLANINGDGVVAEVAAKIYVLRARAYLRRNQATEANAELDRALALDPGSPEAMEIRVETLIQRRDIAGAEAVIDELLTRYPTKLKALVLKGDIRRAQSDFPNAIHFYDLALEQRPDDVAARIGRAASLVALGRDEDASGDVSAVLARYPGYPLALFLRASLLAKEGKLKEALEVLQPVSSELENFTPAQLLLAELNLRFNRPQQAREYAQRAYSATPDSRAARIALAKSYLGTNEPMKAIELLEPIAADPPGDAALQSALAEAYSRAGRYEDSVKVLDRRLASDPKDGPSRTRMAANLFWSGDTDEAVKNLNEVINSNSDSTSAQVLLFSVYMQTGQVENAWKLADELRSVDPTQFFPEYLLGLAKERMGDRLNARGHFRSALLKKSDYFPAATALVRLSASDGKWDEARDIYVNFLKVNPSSMPAMLSLAQLAQANGNSNDASGWLERASTVAPRSVEPRIAMIDLLLAQNRPDRALLLARTVTENFRDNVPALYAVARAQFANKQEDAAVDTLQRIADLQPNSAAEQLQLGRNLKELGRSEEARVAYMRAVKLDPSLVPAWRELAFIEAQIEGVDAGIQTAEGVSATDPSSAEEIKGDVYVEAGRFDEAERAFTAAFALRPSSSLMARRARARFSAGDNAAAQEMLSRWIETHPSDFPIQQIYASSLLQDKNYPAAARVYEAMLQRMPENPLVLNNLAWLYGGWDPSKAVELARKAHSIDPNSAELNDTLGWLLVTRGDLAEATGLLTSAHEKRPEDPAISYRLAVALSKQGEREKAIEILKPFIDSEKAFDERADAYALLKELGSER